MVYKVPKRVKDTIALKIESLFDLVKAKLLGPRGLNKTLFVKFDRQRSLPGMYEAAIREEAGLPNVETLGTLIDSSKNYLDSLKHKTVNKVIKDIESHVASGSQVTPETIQSTIQDSWDGISRSVQTIVASEVQAAKSIGLLEGILRNTKGMGIEDPVVCFITTKDNHVCSECLRLHVLEDKITPRAWYLSEISNGYHSKGGDVPSVMGLHPNCRCHLVTILPGYGFVGGQLKYIDKNYSEIEKQRS